MRIATETIPDGNAGITATLRAIDRLVDEALLDGSVIELAHDIVRHLPARDTDAEASAIFNWVRAHVRYTHDPIATDPDVGPADQVKTPGRLIQEVREFGRAVGDCDDYVGLLLTLLRAVGIRCQAVVLSERPGPYSHVMVRYASPRRKSWVTLDAITSNEPGWFPSHVTQIGSFDGRRIRRETGASVQGLVVGSPALGGYMVEGAVSQPENRLARASRALSPYTDLLWFAWAGISFASAVGIVRASRRRRSR